MATTNLGAVGTHRGPMPTWSWLAFALALGFAAPAANADTVYQSQDSGSGNNWNTAAIWDGSAPVSTNDYVNRGGTGGQLWTTYGPTTNVAFTGGELVIQGAAGDYGGGRLFLQGTGTRNVANGLTLDGGRIYWDTDGATTLTTGSAITLGAGGGVIQIGSGSTNARTLTVNQAMVGSGGIVVEAGQSNHVVVFSGAGLKTYTGETRIAAGATLRTLTTNVLTTGSGDTNVIGTLEFTGATSVAALTGTGSVNYIGSNNNTLTLGRDGVGDKTFSGVISPGPTFTLNLAKTGNNRQILSGTNAYNGTTTINNGQLRIVGGGLGGTGAVSVATDTTLGTAGTLELENLSVAKSNPINLRGRADASVVHLDNLAGTNTLSGTVTLQNNTSADPDFFNIRSTAGTLILQGNLAANSTQSSQLGLSGAGDGAIQGTINLVATGTSNLRKTGSGTWTLSGAGTNIDGSQVSEGSLRLSGAGTLGLGAVTVDGSGTLGLQGLSANFTNALTLVGRSGTGPAHIDNVAGNNNITQTVTLADGAGTDPDQFLLSSQSGLLTLGALTASGTQNAILDLSGAGDGRLSGAVNLLGGSSAIVKRGAGTWTLNAAVSNVSAVDVVDGTLALTNLANVSGVSTVTVEDAGTVDATGVVVNFNVGTGKRLRGAGTVKGNVTVDGTLEVGVDPLAVDLDFIGNLTFAANSILKIGIDVGTGASDRIDVTGNLSLDSLMDLQLDWLGGVPTHNAYVIASYGLLSGAFSQSLVLPTGYHLDYAYDGQQLIAIARDNPVPAPGTLALIALGGLALGARRRARASA